MEQKIIDQLQETREWVKRHYPDSDIADSKEPEFQNEILEELTNFFALELLGFCGCGKKDLTIESMRDYLKIVNDCTKKNDNEAWDNRRKQLEKTFGYGCVCDNGVLQYMAYDLDNRGLTDHGSNIAGAWITDIGEKCLFVFDTYLKEKYPEDGESNE